jgi:hypothetical protein
MSSVPMATNLTLYGLADEAGNGSTRYMHRNITAPEQCIYRQHVEFVKAVSAVLHREVFQGYCTWYHGFHCYLSGNNKNTNMLATLGVGAVMRTLFNNGAMQFHDINAWFESFANAMTNRFRFEYGTNIFNDTIRTYVLPENGSPELTAPSAPPDLPLGLIQGLAWQTTTCISMHIYWLLLPVVLTLVTGLLLIWTIITDWRHRHDRPVWKESILPLIFYSHKIESTNPDVSAAYLPQNGAVGGRDSIYEEGQRHPDSTSDEEGGPVHGEETLLEANKMKEISKNIPITFVWSNSAETSSTTALHQEKDSLRRRQPEAMEVDSLLGESEQEPRPASRISSVTTDTPQVDGRQGSMLDVSRPSTAASRT